ncbi:hypothetical protein C8R43DRAFT_1127306 [Mycena crocata]|nr:hypothetical protein C8R43DRAFT_1127306 [Mycena crocata]
MSDYQVYGYLLPEKALNNIALQLELRLTTPEDRMSSFYSAAEQLVGSIKIYPFTIAGVVVNKRMRMCAAIASEEEMDRLPMPPASETIDKLKKLLHTQRDPKWYAHA